MEQYLTPPVSGPRGIGQLAAIAVGAYTEIVEIIAPSEAAAGDLVAVEVRVENTWTDSFYIGVSGSYDGVDIFFSPDYALVDPEATYTFTYSFTMPNNDIRLLLASWYWTGTEWYQDDYSYVDIALKAAAPPIGCLPLVLLGLAILAAIAVAVAMVS